LDIRSGGGVNSNGGDIIVAPGTSGASAGANLHGDDAQPMSFNAATCILFHEKSR
jgi:hypothetical protein